MTLAKPFLELTGEDVMTRDVVTIQQAMSLPEAAHVLHQAGIGEAPVVDFLGRCVGMVSAFDFVHWAEGAREPDPAAKGADGRVCSYLRKGDAAGGDWICVLAAGSCSYQGTRPTTAGRHVSVCLRPHGDFDDWHQMTEHLPRGDAVRHYMTADVVTVSPEMRLPELARKMVDAHIHRVVIIDRSGIPV